MKNLLIRKAHKSELPVIQELNYQLFLHDEVYDPQLKMNWPFDTVGKEYFEKRIAGDKCVCFVAELTGEIVGYLAGGIIEPYSYRKIEKQSELENTLVTEKYRGHGIGEKLFEEFLKWSKQQGAQRIKVTAATGNMGAIVFYKRVGFEPYATELEFEIT